MTGIFLRAGYRILIEIMGPALILFSNIPPLERRWFLRERLGRSMGRKAEVWIHCSSLGESTGALNLIELLLHNFPQTKILLTVFTPTARRKLETKNIPQPVTLRCAPLDHPTVLRNFFDRIQPQLFLIYESDFWPLTLKEAKKRSLPVRVVSARMTHRSRNLLKFSGAFAREMFSRLDCIYPQYKEDRQAFLSLTSDVEKTSGDWKAPLKIAPRLIPLEKRCFDLTLLSVHKDEWPAVKKGLQKLGSDFHIVFIPRYPSEAHWWKIRLKNLHLKTTLVNTFGQVQKILPESKNVLVGGSLARARLHSVWEPLEFACRVFVGPSIKGKESMLSELQEAGLLRVLTKQSWKSSLEKDLPEDLEKRCDNFLQTAAEKRKAVVFDMQQDFRPIFVP